MNIIDNRKYAEKELCNLKDGAVFVTKLDCKPSVYLKLKGKTETGLSIIVDLTYNELNYVSTTLPVTEIDAKIIIEGEAL